MPPLQEIYQRKKSHHVKPDKYMWNKKYKSYRFKSTCNKLEVDFKPHHKFTVDLGGYAEKEGSESKWRCAGAPERKEQG